MRYLFMTLGSISLLFGLIGMLMPIIPAVPFVMFALYCFARGSERFYTWLTTHRVFGPMIARYRRTGVPPWVKFATIAGVTISVAVSYYLIDTTVPRIVLIVVWTLVVFLILLLPSRRDGVH